MKYLLILGLLVSCGSFKKQDPEIQMLKEQIEKMTVKKGLDMKIMECSDRYLNQNVTMEESYKACKDLYQRGK